MKKYIVTILTILVGALYTWIIVLGNDPLQASISSKILRFHVLANSDSAEDQAVKEEVRDAVGAYLSPLLQDANNIWETKLIVNKHMDTIILVAKETLQKHGYSYEVSAQITDTMFPEKSYGEYTFPKGKYEALRL